MHLLSAMCHNALTDLLLPGIISSDLFESERQMSIPSFVIGIWLAIISVVGAILLCGVFGMTVYKVSKWDFRRLDGVTTRRFVPAALVLILLAAAIVQD